MIYIVVYCVDMLIFNGSDVVRCIIYWYICFSFWRVLLNGYVLFLLWYVFVICFNSEDIKNN